MRFPRRNSQTAMTTVVLCAAFLLAAFIFYFWDQISPYSGDPTLRSEQDAAERQRQYAGTIKIPEGVIGRCRRLKFDNATGAVEEGDAGPCHDDTPPPMPAEERLNSIRDSFLNR